MEQTTGGGGACPDPFEISDKRYRVSRRKVKREEDQVGMTRNDTQGGTEADVKTRISKARAAFHILRNVWKSRVIGKQKNPSVQHKCQACVAIQHTENDPDICKSVLVENIANTVDGQRQQQGPLGENKPS